MSRQPPPPRRRRRVLAAVVAVVVAVAAGCAVHRIDGSEPVPPGFDPESAHGSVPAAPSLPVEEAGRASPAVLRAAAAAETALGPGPELFYVSASEQEERPAGHVRLHPTETDADRLFGDYAAAVVNASDGYAPWWLRRAATRYAPRYAARAYGYGTLRDHGVPDGCPVDPDAHAEQADPASRCAEATADAAGEVLVALAGTDGFLDYWRAGHAGQEWPESFAAAYGMPYGEFAEWVRAYGQARDNGDSET